MTTSLYAARRARVAAQLGQSGIASIPTPPERPRNRANESLFPFYPYFHPLPGFTSPTPSLLLLAEPLACLAPLIVQALLRAIRRITREEGLCAILVEQHPQAILAISDSAAVLDRGTVVYAGSAESLQEQPQLLDKLLGVAR